VTDIIRSNHYKSVVPDFLEVLVDSNRRRGPVIGLKVDPVKAESFIMPVTYGAAKSLADSILRTLHAAAPEMFA
jgi:enhancing lycopene biosynthesis protein 2